MNTKRHFAPRLASPLLSRATPLLMAAALTAAGCGLVDPNITEFQLRVPEKRFIVNTDQWMLNADLSEMPAVPCDLDPSVCAAGLSEYCENDAVCFGTCNNTCEVTVLVALPAGVNLAEESEDLSIIDDQPFIEVNVQTMAYDIIENTFNVDTPALTVYVAPQSVLTPGDPQALPVGTIAPITAGTRLADREMVFTADGKDNLRRFMNDFRTPFQIIVGADVLIQAGDPMPSGRIEAAVRITATASP